MKGPICVGYVDNGKWLMIVSHGLEKPPTAPLGQTGLSTTTTTTYPLEDLVKRTKLVSEIGVEDLKHLLSFVGVDCKKMKKQELVSRLQQHLEQQASQANQDPS